MNHYKQQQQNNREEGDPPFYLLNGPYDLISMGATSVCPIGGHNNDFRLWEKKGTN